MEKYRVYAGIDLDAVRYNMESMHNNINKDTKIVAVVKADGYGHGALKIAEAIRMGICCCYCRRSRRITGAWMPKAYVDTWNQFSAPVSENH